MAGSKPRIGARGARKVKTGCETCKYDPTRTERHQSQLTKDAESDIRSVMKPGQPVLNATALADAVISLKVIQTTKSELRKSHLPAGLGRFRRYQN